MTSENQKRIQMIDQQSYWYQLFEDELKGAGFTVEAIDSYDDPAIREKDQDKMPDLVILECNSIRDEEQALIAQLLENKRQLLILCNHINTQTMRALFLQGVVDVTSRSYRATTLINLIIQTLNRITDSKVLGS